MEIAQPASKKANQPNSAHGRGSFSEEVKIIGVIKR